MSAFIAGTRRSQMNVRRGVNSDGPGQFALARRTVPQYGQIVSRRSPWHRGRRGMLAPEGALAAGGRSRQVVGGISTVLRCRTFSPVNQT